MVVAVEKNALFTGISPQEIQKMLGCLSAREKRFWDQQQVWPAGEPMDQIGLVLEGRVLLENDDFWGNRFIASEVPAGSTVGEAYALTAEPLPFNAVSKGDSRVLFLDVRRMMRMCDNACSCHRAMNERLLKIIADQAKDADRKIKHLSGRTTRDKLLSYLSEEARRQQTAYIDLPFNRQELADYLSVERSAMSRELSKMKAEGLIDYSRNVFALKNPHHS